MMGSGEQNRSLSTLVCDVPCDRKMRTVTVDCRSIEVETAGGIAGFILRLMSPKMRDFVIRINVTHDFLQ
jgi:hypothetical protein